MKFSPLPCYLVPLRPKYFPQHPILKHSQLLLLLQFSFHSVAVVPIRINIHQLNNTKTQYKQYNAE
jgi:hypothetical protein